jgi:hypothetical protein
MMNVLSPPEPIEMAVRAFSPPPALKQRKPKAGGASSVLREGRPPSPWSLTFDTEFTVDAAQQLRVGSYQIRDAGELVDAGLFFDPLSLSDQDRDVVYRYAVDNHLRVRDVGDFIESVFFRVLVDWGGQCIGFNLPVDIARLAIRHATAASLLMRGGFTFLLSENPRRPRVQIRHLNSAESFIRLTYPPRQPTPRGMRKRGFEVPRTRGSFVDVHTAAAALLEHRGDLRSLAKLLSTPTQKGDADYDDPAITPAFLDYAMADVQVTWECYGRLAARYETLGLATPLAKIYSAASLGKAQLDTMGIRPWMHVQPNASPSLIGRIMSTYFGGRSEVHRRREVVQVLYADFLSMYPTVCSLMGLWRYVTGAGIETYDATAEARALLASITALDLQQPETWTRLGILVELEPACDLLPVRGKYDGQGYTIGLNYLSTAGVAVWCTLADAMVAVINGDHAPTIRRAVGFLPGPILEGLRPVDLMGKPTYRVDPATDDVFRRLIELRTELKAKRDAARTAEETDLAEQYDTDQLALKIMANATSYGIFIELNVTDSDDPIEVTCFGRTDEPFSGKIHQTETPGRFFDPILGTLITGAARLMLGLAERAILDAGLDWAFCDTDSMAIARPDEMSEAEFIDRTRSVLDWFEPLKPYRIPDPLFKLEDANFRLDSEGHKTKELGPLYCFAISDKRYALFNLDANGRPVVRKASGHGLGHLRPPYEPADGPASIPPPLVKEKDLGVPRWQHDFWYRIIDAALDGHPALVDLGSIPGLDVPAVSRYGATTPALLRWFDRYNAGRPYREQVRPFGFLLAFQARGSRLAAVDPLVAVSRRRGAVDLSVPAVAAPYARDAQSAAHKAFDRETGEPVPADRLRTYREVLAQYHLHPEAKFHSGDFLDSGPTTRRHVRPLGPIDNIGKEANRWEEQFYLGANPETQIGYGVAEGELAAYAAEVRNRAQKFGVREISREASVSVGTVSAFVRGKATPSVRIIRAIDRAIGRHVYRGAR